MQENRVLGPAFRGFGISLVCILLAICALALSTKYLYPENPYCHNMLGAGFPVMFICDDWGGGSPTGSWNKIDFVDVLNGGILPGGFVMDFLFYFILTGVIWYTGSSITKKEVNQSDLLWTIFISIGFITGFLCAFLVFLPSYFNSVRPPVFHIPTPTPTLSLQTPIGTISTVTPTLTPIVTLNP